MNFATKLIFVISSLIISNSAFASNCPTSVGEANPCDLENAKVQSLLKDLKPLVKLTYCGSNPGKDEACRWIIRYQDKNGNISNEIFEDWFVLKPGTPDEKRWRGFMVRGANNLSEFYWDDETQAEAMGEYEVDFFDPLQSKITVSNDLWFPKFEFHYNNVKGGDPVRAIASYTMEACTIQKYDTGKAGLGEKLVYPLVSIEKLNK